MVQPKKQVRAYTPFKLVLIPYLTLLAFSPLPLASNRPFPEALLALGAGLILLTSLAYPQLRKSALTQFHHHKVSLSLFSVVCLWILFQWSTWSPTSFHHPIWEFTAQTLSLSLESRISINPDGTLRGLMHILTYWSIGWVGLLLAKRQRTADIILKTLIVIGCCYALYGIVIYLTGNRSILVYEKWAYHTSLTSTFVNRNSYATYAGLIGLLSVGYIVREVNPIISSSQAFSIKLKALLEHFFQHQLWLVIAILLLMTSLALTASRAGTVSSLVAFVALILFMFQNTKYGKQKTNWTALASILGVAILVFVLSAEQLGVRIEGFLFNVTSVSRWRAYALTLGIIADSPILGIGLGGFEDAFQAYRDITLPWPTVWDKAHNTYLELMLELGIPVAVFYFLAIGLLIRSIFQGVKERRSGKLYPVIGFSASILVSLHSLVDFSLQIPAVSVTFAAILGVSLAQSSHRSKRKQ